MTLSEFIHALITAEFSLYDMAVAFFRFYEGLWTDFNISEMVSGMWWHLRYVKPFLPFILFVIYTLVATLGNKMFGFLRFSVLFISGFIIGIYTLSPLVLEVMPNLPTWVIGLITGIVAGVLSKILYFLIVSGGLGYSTYVVFYSGSLPVLAGLTAGSWLVGLIAAAAVIALTVVFSKYIEMASTALLGGYGMACIVRGWYDYSSMPVFVGKEWLGVLTVTLIFALIGFVVQMMNRETYD